MTDFHCIRKHENVRVSNNKVCGFRTQNRATKKGWSSGLRTGSDNACGHRLSRFSTDEQAECASNYCEGNTNWLAYDGPEFYNARVNEPWALHRDAFRAGTSHTINQNIHLPPNQRHGMGNYEMVRPAFTAPRIEPRQALDFDKINAINIAQFGQKIQLGEKTLEALLGVKMPDPSDRSWIDEYNRRKRLGETDEQLKRNPPFGRPQRTIKKRINFGEAKLSMDGSLSAIKAAVDAGRAETIEQKRLLGLEIARVLGSTENIRRLTGQNLGVLKDAISRIRVPKNYIANGFDHRIFGNAQYLAQQGLITLFLLANPKITNLNLPIRSENSRNPNPDADSWISLNSLVSALRRPGDRARYLDLATRRLITKATALRMVRAGVDNGLLDGVPLAPPVPGAAAAAAPEVKEGDLIDFITDELKAAYPGVANWEEAIRGGDPESILELYTNRGIDPPPNLVAAQPLLVVPGEFGVADEPEEITGDPRFLADPELERLGLI
jgi:hypothetical protein